MKVHRSAGLWAGLLVALVTVGLVASGASLAYPAVRNDGAIGAAPTTVVAELPAASPTAVPSPTLSPSATATPTAPATANAVSVPTSQPTDMPSPTDAPTPLATSAPSPAADAGQVIGHSVQGRPIVAHRIGEGSLKVVLVGDIHGQFEENTFVLAQQLLEHFQARPEEVPATVSLWIIPTMNPDGLATGHRWNANDVDLNRNADTDLDGCAGNDWSPDTVGLEGPHPGAGGAYPFSEPEARAVRDFLDDAWVAVFYHSAAEAIFVDTCQRHPPTARLAEVLSTATGYPVPDEGWTGYRITGEFSDYLAGEGVAAVTVELTDHEDPEFERNLAGVQALLASAGEIVGAEATGVGAEMVWLGEDNTGAWRYAENSFVHPIALEVLGDTAYLLDGGRVLSLNLDRPGAPELLLAPGADVEGVRVLEPLDLAVDGTSLLALDRAGDVYRYEPGADTWTLERYDRPAGDTYDHYFVALAGSEGANYLLETTHEQVWRFADGEQGAALIKLPQSRDVDISANGGDVYVLTRDLNRPTGSLLPYSDARRISTFRPNVDLMHPRQVVAAGAAVYVLDRAGRRLLTFDRESGALLALRQFADRRDVGAIWVDPAGKRLILAGRDRLFFHGQPERQATVDGGPVLEGPQPQDLAFLEGLRGLSVPIEGATLTTRDFQMPGAPRHYRLGVHEGMDFYEHTVGVPVDRRTPVRAVGDGVVVRALLDYQPLTAAQAQAWSARSQSLGYTPPEVLDGYRGMQVWIDHGDGVVSRYAHLGSIAPGVIEGASVTRGQVIATVGNSGTPSSVQSQTNEVHLHLELWVGDHFVGQFLRPIEAREWLEKILR
jgi:murein DD-endopeptidase MepM/ murein hydrolase activator NlpD/predicted deacylase